CRAVADAEDGAWRHPELRVGVFALEVPDGTWGGDRRIIRLPDIYELVWPPAEGIDGEPREAAEEILAERRRREAAGVRAAAGGAVGCAQDDSSAKDRADGANRRCAE